MEYKIFNALKKLVTPQPNGKKFYETVDGDTYQKDLLEAERLGLCTHKVESDAFVSGSFMQWQITEEGKRQYAKRVWEYEAEWKYDKHGKDLQGKSRPTVEEFTKNLFATLALNKS